MKNSNITYDNSPNNKKIKKHPTINFIKQHNSHDDRDDKMNKKHHKNHEKNRNQSHSQMILSPDIESVIIEKPNQTL